MLAALLVTTASACGGGADAAFEPGRYAYTLTDGEQDAFRALWSGKEASQLHGIDEITTLLEFSGAGWVQSWMLDGSTWTFDDAGLLVRDYFGTFSVDGDRLELVVEDEFEGTLTYRWSFARDTLSLDLIESSAGPAHAKKVAIATEHDFTRLGE